MTTAQDQQSRAELLPCPFCGTIPTLEGDGDVLWITCPADSDCRHGGMAMGIKKDDQEAGIASWNRRAPAGQAARALPAGEPAAWMSSEDDHYQGTSADWQVSGDKRANDDIALYTAAQVQAVGRVPPGFKAVPVEPTGDMLVAIMSEGEVEVLRETPEKLQVLLIDRAGIPERYAALLAAAPRPPAAREGA